MDQDLARAALIDRDLSAYTTEWLCATYPVDLSDALTAVIDAIDEPWKQPPEEPIDVALRGVKLFGQKQPDPLWLAVARRSRERATNVIVYWRTLYAIAEEFVRRAPPGGVTTLQAFLSNTALYEELLGAMKLEHLTDYRYLDDPRDLQQEALQGAFKRYLKEQDNIDAGLPSVVVWPPPPTVSLLGVELPGARWAFWRHLRQKLMRDFPIQFLPLITPRFAELPKAARQGWRRVVEQRDAKMRGGIGIIQRRERRRAQKAGHAVPPIQPAWQPTDPEPDANSATAIPLDDSDKALTARLYAQSLIEVAEKYWGLTGRILCEELAHGATDKAAAAAAGISRKTAYKWLNALRSPSTTLKSK
jgi:hypothetical protein